MPDGDSALTILWKYKLSSCHRFLHPSLPILVVGNIGGECLACLVKKRDEPFGSIHGSNKSLKAVNKTYICASKGTMITKSLN